MTELYIQAPSSGFLDNGNHDESPIEGGESIAHLYEVITEGKKHKYVCKMPDCTKSFRFKSEIERHISAHSEHRPHQCTYADCQRAFKRQDALENHIRSQHTGEASLFCPHPECGKNFTTNAKLRYHMLLHLEEKPYKCSIAGCERSFVTLSQLKQHENSSSVHKKVGKEYKKKDKPKDKASVQSKNVEQPNYEEEEEEEEERVERREKMVKTDHIVTNMKAIEDMQDLTMAETPMAFLHPFEHGLSDPMAMVQPQSTLFEGKHVLNHVLSENEVLKNKLEQTTSLLNVIKSQMNQFAAFRPEDIAQIMMPKANHNVPFKSMESKGAFHFHQKPVLDTILWENNGMRDQLFNSHYKDIDIHLENYFDKAGDMFTAYNNNNNNIEENPFMHFD